MSAGRGAPGPYRSPGRPGSGCVPLLGAGLGKPHPEGLVVCAGQRQKQQRQQDVRRKRRSQAWERRQHRQEEGAGSLEGGLEGQGPVGLSQDGLGPGGWTREGQGQHCWWSPPPPHRAVLTCVPAAAAATAVGLGVPNTGAPAPLCRAAQVLHLLWLSLPAPLSLPGDGEAGRGLVAPRAPSPRTA